MFLITCFIDLTNIVIESKYLNYNWTLLTYYVLIKKSIYASNKQNMTIQMRPEETKYLHILDFYCFWGAWSTIVNSYVKTRGADICFNGDWVRK